MPESDSPSATPNSAPFDARHLPVPLKPSRENGDGWLARLMRVLFGMKPSDYKRFLAFLYQHDCHLPFHGFREPRTDPAASSSSSSH